MDQPQGELVIQTIAMPKDTNPNGDIFGGWLMSQMDLGSGILAAKTAQARVVTVAMEAMSFLEPVRVGDTVACYAWVEKIGRTCRVTNACGRPRSNSGVKCNPAVGAATAPGTSAKTVW